jgi:hypothetical protein
MVIRMFIALVWAPVCMRPILLQAASGVEERATAGVSTGVKHSVRDVALNDRCKSQRELHVQVGWRLV